MRSDVMVSGRLAHAVRRQLGLGRLLPLGEADDGSWIAERAAASALRDGAGAAVSGVRLDTLRLSLADPHAARPAAVPPPPSALPYGPLRVTAGFAAAPGEPLPAVADQLRSALERAAAERLGLAVAAVDLRVTGLLDGADEVGTGADAGDGDDGAGPVRPPETGDDDLARAALAAAAVPGVSRLAPALGLPPATRAVRVSGVDGEAGRHILVQLAVAPGHRALDVTRAVRAAVTSAVAPASTVAALVTTLD